MNRVAYLITTNYFSDRGLEVLRGQALADAGNMDHPFTSVTPAEGAPYVALDDRPYRLGDSVVRLQDERGLCNINFPDRGALGRLLGAYGVPYDDRDGLIDKLLDYIDRNPTLSRLNGATGRDYQEAGRPPPRNGPLLTPWEAYRVLGWDQYGSLWRGEAPLPEMIALNGNAIGLNPNTAPEAVLRSIPGLGDDQVAQVLQYRATYPINSADDLDRATGATLPYAPGQFLFFPASSLRLTLAAARDPEIHFVSLRLTPIGPTPYRIDYDVARPRSGADRDLVARKDMPAFPEFADSP